MHIITLGAPPSLQGDWLSNVMASAVANLNEEQARSTPGFDQPSIQVPILAEGGAVADPDVEEGPAGPGSTQMASQLEIWKLLPHVRELPVNLVSRLPLSALFQLNSALAKESKLADKMNISQKLTHNASSLLTNPVKIAGGQDDRKDQLHEARFLGGASCAGQTLWLKARDVLGAQGVVPIGNYDMDVVGCGGCVTPRGWAEIHNPGSPDLKLKLFYMPNVGSSALSTKRLNLEDGENAVSIGESLREIADLDGFRAALNTAREAQAVALPWNRSIAAIQGFMMNTNYCAADLQGNNKRAAVLSEFVDFAFSRNALNWENRQPFLSCDDLTHAWASWKGKRAAYFTSSSSKKDQEPKEKKERDDICRRYNRGDCPFKPEECKTSMGRKLRHVCNFAYPGGRRCGQDHAKPDHK
jgi:hypothetical protein